MVARRSLPASVNLVGRRVASGQEAQQAASDGASLLLVEVRLHLVQMQSQMLVCSEDLPWKAMGASRTLLRAW